MRALLLVATLAATLTAQPVRAQISPPAEDPFISHVLPVAAGALVGTAVTFFILPLIVPALASGVPSIGPAVGTPLVGAVGAVVGGVVGYSMFE